MKRKEGLEGLVKNFDYELDKEEDVGHSDDWYNVHINMLYNELCEIRDTLFVLGEVEKEWEKRAECKLISYFRIRSIIYNALPYKVIMGLSKIFVGTKEFSLEKTINVISQRDVYKEKQEVRVAVENIRYFLNDSIMVKNVTEYRDNFFGHLDASCAMSDIRISPSEAMQYIPISEVDRGIGLIGNLYKECFGTKLKETHNNIEIEDIIQTFFGCSVK